MHPTGSSISKTDIYIHIFWRREKAFLRDIKLFMLLFLINKCVSACLPFHVFIGYILLLPITSECSLLKINRLDKISSKHPKGSSSSAFLEKRFNGPNLLIFLFLALVIILLLYHGFLRRFYFWTSLIKIFEVVGRKPWQCDRTCLDIDTNEFETVL